jgi:predicted DNA-binding ribbon-helix-helix protein
MTKKTVEELIEAAAAEAEATKDGPMPSGTTWTRPNRTRSVVQSVRLPGEAYAAIERIAAENNVSIGALIRGWVLQGLAAEQESTLASAVQLLAADVERIRRLARVAS